MSSFRNSALLQGCHAVLGGSFDPIHLGHLHIAKQILEKSPVEQVIFVPNGIHNFKKDQLRLDFDQRYALVQEAIKDEARFTISALDRDGSGYTADLMRSFQTAYPTQKYVFVIGSDNLQGLKAWFDYAWLRQYIGFLILPRPGFEINESDLAGLKACILDIELSPISATQIRNLISRGESIHGLVPKGLEKQINKLYSKLLTCQR